MSNQETSSTRVTALQLACEYRPTMPIEVMRLWAVDAAAELRNLHAANVHTIDLCGLALADVRRLQLENDDLRSSVPAFPESYEGSTLAERRPHGTGCRVVFHFGNTEEAEKWMESVLPESFP